MPEPKDIHILIVEDSLTQAMQLQFFLEKNGYTVTTANNGQEGTDFARKVEPSLVISDIVMPQMDGYEMCGIIKSDEQLKGIPVILLTSLSNPQDVIKALACKADNFVTKPYDEKFLLSRIQHILVNKEMRHRGTPEMGIEVFFAGETHFITSDRMQIVDLLFSTYENAVERNKELMRMQLELKEANEKLSELAKFDSLTGIANRRMYQKFLKMELERSMRHNLNVAVLFMDLDNFKDVNDTKGHDIGDLLLQNVAERVKSCVRPEDLIARLGGDEFAIVLVETRSADDAAVVAEKILSNLAKPHNLEGHEIISTFSIGIAVFPGSGKTVEDLGKAADIAMYHAKKSGKNNYQFFEPDMQKQAMQRMQMEKDLRTCLDNNELSLYYQPQIETRTGNIIGLEALLRWQHPTFGAVSPAVFIPIAEKSGLIGPLGEWVLESACSQNAKWHKKNGSPFKVAVAVNVSLKQLRYKSFWELVKNILDKTGLDAHDLEIELTESTVMEDPEAAIILLEKIHNLGVRIAIDDFGTGYSSLSYLRRLPIDSLKIDLSFVQNIGKSNNDETIIKAIIALAHNLSLQVTAEGVETQAQLDFLKAHQCDIMQGFYFEKPMPVDDVEKLIMDDFTSIKKKL
ncbi:EAL domain-containing protein [Candidatus Pacearchaeota archaeon]|nr:EAL domain-containing protein [Candidatus Pacearchaeota archaeon]